LLSVIAAQAQTKSLADQKVEAEIEMLKAETKVQEATLEKVRLDYEAQKAQTNKLAAETRKLELESHTFRAEELLKWLLGAAGLTIPFVLAMWQLAKQSANQLEAQAKQADLERGKIREQAKLEAQLKAIEIAMSSPTSGGVKNRLQVMKKIMPDWFVNVPDKLDFENLGFASYRERFLKLIQLIAEHPESKLLAVEAYRALLTEGDKINSKLDALAARYKESGTGGSLKPGFGSSGDVHTSQT
jgi:hypothetical protein